MRATENSVCWSLDRTTFRKFLAASSNQALQDVSSSLRSIPLLQGLTDSHLNKLASCTTSEKFDAGEKIITKGEIGEKFYILKEGAVVCTDIINSATGEPVNDVKLTQGAHFGEVRDARDARRARAIESSRALIPSAPRGLSLALARSARSSNSSRAPRP